MNESDPKDESQGGGEALREAQLQEAKMIYAKATGPWPAEHFENGYRAALSKPDPLSARPGALQDVAAERRRQVEAEGWTPEHDDEHCYGEIARGAATYALLAAANESSHAAIPKWLKDKAAAVWPWDSEWLKPSDTRRNLVKAGALILAEIERLDRATPAPGDDSLAAPIEPLDHPAGLIQGPSSAAQSNTSGAERLPKGEPLCMCKDRALSACPGEWELGCDLGNNEKFMRRGPSPGGAP